MKRGGGLESRIERERVVVGVEDVVRGFRAGELSRARPARFRRHRSQAAVRIQADRLSHSCAFHANIAKLKGGLTVLKQDW